ncbi:PREDICTED: uncharacterized protein LOC106744119 [Dinoponera quadriceps]|uniref:Uncharacterized protein LOC106744119 n=1 Tax=Dinoponera quadriceps TaxID=609295 RepID=A0A6P3X863_DINQU|nr:PREDICTED: uncharacterized protein LOC106744119 [Dinoponera quadriceps]
MSERQSDSYDSRPVTSRRERPPFKLCFSRNQQIGRSNACISRVNADFVTPKFYSRELEEMQRNADVSETVEKIAAMENKVPRDSHRLPLLTSHTYGWWHDRGIHPKDPRFNFHKRTSDLVSFQMKIYAEDRKLKGLQQ